MRWGGSGERKGWGGGGGGITHHGKEGGHRHEDVFAVDVAHLDCAALQQRAVVVGAAAAREHDVRKA